MDESVICLEDSPEIIDLSETMNTPQNSRDDLYQEFFIRKRKKNKKEETETAIPEVVIDLSNESDIDLSKDSGPTEGQNRKSSEMCCPICFEKYSDVQLKVTICGHVFCTTCIEATIKEKRTCPKCRKKLTMKNLIPLYL